MHKVITEVDRIKPASFFRVEVKDNVKLAAFILCGKIKFEIK